jgi:hypothetical protein
MIGTNERREINNIYNKWVGNKEDLESNSTGVILWLQTHGMLNEEGVRKYIKYSSERGAK